MKKNLFKLLFLISFTTLLLSCKNERTATISEINIGNGNFKFPIISLRNEDAKKSINDYLIFSIDERGLDSLKNEFIETQKKIDNQVWVGITSMNYTINYNNESVLSITISHTYMGAYPTDYSKSFNFDLKTGYTFGVNQFINPSKQIDFRKLIANDIKERLTAECNKIPFEDWESVKGDWNIALGKAFEMNEGQSNTFDLDDYTLSESGITFNICTVALPHVFGAYEPSSKYYFSWDKLKPYLSSVSPISLLVNKK